MEVKANKPAVPGEVDAGTIYRLQDFAARMGLGKAGLRQARRAGLPVRHFGRNAYVVGKEALEWILTQPTVKG